MRSPRLATMVAILVLAGTAPTFALKAEVDATFFVTGDVREVTSKDALSGDGVTWVADGKTRLDVPRPTYYVVTNAKGGSGVEATFGIELGSAEVVAAVQLAFNEKTGESLMAVGVPTDKSLEFLRAEAKDAPDWLFAPAAANAPVKSTAQAWTSGRGAVATFWTDPLTITVSDVITEVRWEYNGTKVRNPRVDDTSDWFQENGWSEVLHQRGKYLNAAATTATAWSKVHHKTSSWFPSPTCGTTHIWYDANNAYGGKTGNIRAGVNTYTVGSCGWLLGYEIIVRRGQT